MKLNTLITLLAVSGVMMLSSCENHTTSQSTPAAEPVGAKSDPAAKAAKAKDITDANFAEVTKSGVVLVEFWATWCPPCLEQAPILDDVAGQVAGIATVGKLDIDTSPETAEAQEIEVYPTLIIFKDGNKVEQFIGLTTADDLVAAIKKAAGK